MPRGAIDPIRRFAGVDLSKSARDLEDDQLALSQNAYEASPKRIVTRPQTKEIVAENFIEASNDHNAVLSSFDDKYGQHWMFFWRERYKDLVGSNGYYSTIGYVDADAGVLSVLTGAFKIRPGRPTFLSWNNKLLFFPGTDIGMIVIDPKPNRVFAQDVSWKTSGQWATNQIQPNIAETYRNTIAMAGVIGEDSTVYWMQMDDPAVPYNLLTDTKAIWINRGDGDRITALKTVAVVGGAEYVEPYMMVFKRRSTWVVRGETPTANTDGTLVVTPLLPKVGCVAKETICNTEHGIVWCSGDSVWIAPDASKPIEIGQNIKELLRTLSKTQNDAWHAAYHRGIYRLTVPGNPDPESNAGIHNTTEQWWCDLREFPERVSWWGPMTIPAAASHVETLANGIERLVHIYFDFGVATNMHVVEGDVETADHADAATAYSGVYAPTTKIRFKEFDFGDPMLKKILQAVELEFGVDNNNSTVTVDVIANSGESKATFTPATVPVAAGFVLGTGQLDSGLLGMPLPAYGFHPPNSSRFIARTMQPVLTVSPNPAAAGNGLRKLSTKLVLNSLGLKMQPIKRRPNG